MQIPIPSELSYYPIQSNWKKLKNLYFSEEAKRIWLPEMKEFEMNRRLERGLPQSRNNVCGPTPEYWDTSDWRYHRDMPGPTPKYWSFVCHSACHWLISLNLWVITQAEPKHKWTIVTNQFHSTILGGDRWLFDPNFLALGVNVNEAWDLVINIGQSHLYHIDVDYSNWDFAEGGKIRKAKRFLPQELIGFRLSPKLKN